MLDTADREYRLNQTLLNCCSVKDTNFILPLEKGKKNGVGGGAEHVANPFEKVK